MSDPRDFTYVTIGFAVDIRKLPNPFKIETPFGFPDTIALGNLFDDLDALRQRVSGFPPEAFAYDDDVTPEAVDVMRAIAAKATDGQDWEVVDGFDLATPLNKEEGAETK